MLFTGKLLFLDLSSEKIKDGLTSECLGFGVDVRYKFKLSVRKE